jgi:hypothetical protein
MYFSSFSFRSCIKVGLHSIGRNFSAKKSAWTSMQGNFDVDLTGIQLYVQIRDGN